MSENTFYEKQSFKQWWVWVLLIFVFAYMIYNLFENHEYFSASELIFSIAVPILIMILIFVMKLETKIDTLGIRIRVRLFPFHFQFKYFPWKTIQKVYLREYSPITEYGGWGLRSGMFGKGKAYNISGTIGLQIIFKDQKKLLIGTQKSVEMKSFWRSWKRFETIFITLNHSSNYK